MLSDVDAVWNYDKVSNAIKFNSADVRGWRYSAMYSRSSSDLETYDVNPDPQSLWVRGGFPGNASVPARADALACKGQSRKAALPIA